MITFLECAQALQCYQKQYQRPMLNNWRDNKSSQFIDSLIRLCINKNLTNRKELVLAKINSFLDEQTKFFNPNLMALLLKLKEDISYFPDNQDADKPLSENSSLHTID